MEYRYALSINKPTVAFLHRSPGKIAAEKSEDTAESRNKLQAFRETVQEKLCKEWDSPENLGSVVSRSMVQLMKSTPATGWIRADNLASHEATQEIVQLNRRVKELEAELSRVRKTAPEHSLGLRQGADTLTVRISYFIRYFLTGSATKGISEVKTTWNDLFAGIAPTLITPATEREMKAAASYSLAHQLCAQDKRMRDADLSNVQIDEHDFQTVKVQLRALGLIAESEPKMPQSASRTYWKLTPWGDEQMMQTRAIRREQVEPDQKRVDQS